MFQASSDTRTYFSDFDCFTFFKIKNCNFWVKIIFKQYRENYINFKYERTFDYILKLGRNSNTSKKNTKSMKIFHSV